MMRGKGILTAMGACASLFYGATAYAADGPYFSAMIGTALLSDSTITDAVGDSVDLEFDPGWNFAAAVGYKVGMLRMEGEIGYQINDADEFSGGVLGPLSVSAGGDTDIWRFMANGYFDFDTGTAWIPYIGAGIGFASVSMNDLSVLGILIGSDDDTVLAYQVGAGLGYAVNATTTVFVDYRYFATEDPEFSYRQEAEIDSHNISLGLRYSF